MATRLPRVPGIRIERVREGCKLSSLLAKQETAPSNQLRKWCQIRCNVPAPHFFERRGCQMKAVSNGSQGCSYRSAIHVGQFFDPGASRGTGGVTRGVETLMKVGQRVHCKLPAKSNIGM